MLILRFVTVGAIASIVVVSGAALADVPSDPCQGREEGDDCALSDEEQGHCENGTCVVEEDGGEDCHEEGCDSGCSVSSVGARVAAGSATVLALLGVALGRRRRPIR